MVIHPSQNEMADKTRNNKQYPILRLARFTELLPDNDSVDSAVSSEGPGPHPVCECCLLSFSTILSTVVMHTIFWKFTNPRLTSPSGPIR